MWWILGFAAGGIAIGILVILACIQWALSYEDQDAGPDIFGDASTLDHPDMPRVKLTRYEAEPRGA